MKTNEKNQMNLEKRLESFEPKKMETRLQFKNGGGSTGHLQLPGLDLQW